MTNQPPAVPIEDLRHFLKIRLAVAPRYWFERLWRPKGIATEIDKTRDELVDFITQVGTDTKSASPNSASATNARAACSSSRLR